MNEEDFEINRRHWDEVTKMHARSKFYDLDSFKKGRSSLLPVELSELGDVNEKRLLHLQCHFGMDTLSWARMGAEVTGVDFSAESIKMAKALGKDLNLPSRFIESNIYDLGDVLDEKFDIVFTSYGVLVWLPDLMGWAKIISEHLEHGGTFYIVEGHPLADCLDDKERGHLQIGSRYFWHEPQRFDEPGTYADPSSALVNSEKVEWQHTLDEIINSLLQVGLRLEYVHEFPFSFFERHPDMERCEDGLWRFRTKEWSFPMTFSIKARKP